jgi:hypothetical protein
MYPERVRGNGCAPMVITITVALVLGVGVWWMESRFGPIFAMAVVGSLIGAVLVIAGNLLGLANSRSTLDAAARFNEALAMTEKHRQMTYREQARGGAAWDRANAQLAVLDGKRVDQLAQQRAGLLVDLERQRQAPQSQRPKWNDEETSEYQTWD